jgi:hypothetical protein
MTALHYMLDAATEGGVDCNGYVERPESTPTCGAATCR